MFRRPYYTTLLKRLKEPRRFIQVIAGPRQVGKTTLVQQVVDTLHIPTLYVTADEPTVKGPIWIEQQWHLARIEAKRLSHTNGFVLIFDEIQKIPDWAGIVKRLWDEDARQKLPLKVVLLGSAPLLIQKGLSESLAGRFEQIHLTHWSLKEMQEAFGWTLEQYIYFGGYPGAAPLINDETRWVHYIHDSLIETTLSRDILLLNPVHKPALLRQLFQLGCHYSGQILSYQKMMGQLHDAGNTTTLAHYLELLNGAGMVAGIHKFSGKKIRQRGSSPKFQALNTALISALAHRTFREAQQDRDYWGRLVESAVGAHLLNSATSHNLQIFYWRERNEEVDFIVQSGNKIVPIEVKTDYRKLVHSGIETFCTQYKIKHSLLVGGQGLSLQKFLSTSVLEWIHA